MGITIYADTLVFINTFVTYFLLLASNKILRTQIYRLRILLASFIGGFYALTILLSIPAWCSVLMRIIVCCTLPAVANKRMEIRKYIKTVLVFLAVNFIFAGLMSGISFWLHSNRFWAQVGSIYFDVSISLVLGATILAYALIRLCLRLSAGQSPQTHFGKIIIRTEVGSAQGNGLFDTGNHLQDQFTGKPVILVDKNLANHIVPTGVRDFLHGKALVECDITPEWKRKLRLFPYNTVSGTGLLPAFRSDSITISRMQKSATYSKIYIAVSNHELGAGEYNALFPSTLLDEITKGENTQDVSNF